MKSIRTITVSNMRMQAILPAVDGKENAKNRKKIFLTAKRVQDSDIIVLNSAAGIYIGGKADSYKEAVEIAKQTIDSGKVMDKVNEFVAETKKFN